MESDGNRSSTDSPVEVEAPAQALQIIELTEEKDGEEMLFKFKLNEESLEGILNKIPKGMKVAVVSVVGNFRTGKSFLLTFMLRFLRNRDCKGDTWQTAEGESLTEGNANAEAADESEHQSFEWRGGHERMTTGIWMYSEPFLHVAANGETVAVLVVDTQGLFDNEASMLLTSCIFGLSTLMSSHQIYNVKENVSEDHLQNLALFSEYGRMALANDDDDENNGHGGDGHLGMLLKHQSAVSASAEVTASAATATPAGYSSKEARSLNEIGRGDEVVALGTRQPSKEEGKRDDDNGDTDSRDGEKKTLATAATEVTSPTPQSLSDEIHIGAKSETHHHNHHHHHHHSDDGVGIDKEDDSSGLSSFDEAELLDGDDESDDGDSAGMSTGDLGAEKAEGCKAPAEARVVP
mmetsp:Transcript_54388/g.107955  ORF Transcript_54388/g.107955 Transcript_54388/m.107955 type:complete len:407 (+) Transcript_54388:59-1279(+)